MARLGPPGCRPTGRAGPGDAALPTGPRPDTAEGGRDGKAKALVEAVKGHVAAQGGQNTDGA
jgi:hypothetical protein